jgi:nicotinamide-nucleotide amidase
MKIGIISVGSELVCGQIKDVNAPFIASKLTEIGLDVKYQTVVGDNYQSIKLTLQTLSERVNLIMITGGLGPTMDDITRETVADFCNVRLVTDGESENHIKHLTSNGHGQICVNNLKQAMIPEGGTIIRNLIGTAQGFLVSVSESVIICLPGVYTEMKLMFENWVIPYVLRETGKRRKRCIRVINTFGMSESMLDVKLRQLIKVSENLFCSTLVMDGIVSIHIVSFNGKEDKAVSMLNEVEENICRELGVFVFSKNEEMLEDVVSKLLKKYDRTLAVAESCTGGLISNLLTNVQGSSKFFLEGIISYSNQSKKDLLNVPERLIDEHGSVSAEVAKAMASGVKERAQADIGLSVTGVAGPAGVDKGIDREKPVGLVYVAIVINGDTEYKEYRFFGSRISIKKCAANAALNMLRLRLLKKTTKY